MPDKGTYCAFIGLLPAVHSHMNEELVARVEGPPLALTPRPVTREVFSLPLVDVRLLDMPHQVLLFSEPLPTLEPLTSRHTIFFLQQVLSL